MACRYADAHSPQELWENGIAKRQAFRHIPEERLSVKDYIPECVGEDSIHCHDAAVLEDYEFDRVRFRTAAEVFRSSDMTHWLALDIADQVLTDARLDPMQSALRARTGVYVGNSLTGEFSRANILRLRWPFVRRVLQTSLRECGREAVDLLGRFEEMYKQPFPEMTGESLVGGLSNTISGRIANYFDFKGGAYTVDGACASSLIAVATACSALLADDIDVAIAGGVDLSIDPFELVGFSRLGALARDRMRVFDERSSGFLPGEGCGMIALMRHEEAVRRNLPIRAILRGWGISSDGSGGMTRPEVAGQLLAMERAYGRAGYGIETVGYFEAHGTGTAVGDAVELSALSEALSHNLKHSPATVSTIKANIGHTKAAAGIAGLIRAVMAVQTQILPPQTNCERPHPILAKCGCPVRVLKHAELWPSTLPLRAGISAMGFGGINAHVTIESECAPRRSNFTRMEEIQISSEQDCELFLFEAHDAAELWAYISRLRQFSNKLSLAELTDLSVACARRIKGTGDLRAALVVSNPEGLHTALRTLGNLLTDGQTACIDSTRGVFLGERASPHHIGFLFPGQGSPVYPDGGLLARRFPSIRSLYAAADLEQNVTVATEVVQPAVCAASLAGLEALRLSGIEARVALGHSLGELSAYHWAGAFDSSSLLRLARMRGLAMAQLSDVVGAMASITCSPTQLERLRSGNDVAIAAYNSPFQTVISGSTQAVEVLLDRAKASGFSYRRLGVSHAFHSPLVQSAAEALRTTLGNMTIGPLQRDVVSTVSGMQLAPDANLRALLFSQVTSPVRFLDAITTAASGSSGVALFIEVGPGHALSGITAECVNVPVISLDSGGDSIRGLLLATGAAFTLGASINIGPLFTERFHRPIDLDYKRTFLSNPCESFLASTSKTAAFESLPEAKTNGSKLEDVAAISCRSAVALDVLCSLIARRTDLPLSELKPDSRFLADLHLNSITVSQIVLETAKSIGALMPSAPAEYAGSTLEQAAKALEELQRLAETNACPALKPDGIADWTRMARIKWFELPHYSQPRKDNLRTGGAWDVLSEPGDALGIALTRKFRNCPGSGIVCCIPTSVEDQNYASLLEYTQGALERRCDRIVYVFRDNMKCGAFARSIWLEHSEVDIAIVHVPVDDDRTPEWVMTEAENLSGFVESCYDTFGVRSEPRLEFLPQVRPSESSRLTASDLVLVTGGGKGIAAECALALARKSGCRLALMGRSKPDSDPGLALNLARFVASNVEFRYLSVDVTDLAVVQNALSAVQEEWGPITTVLHGAGANLPKRIERLSVQDIRNTIGPKVDGLRNILSSIDADALTTLITFGSIIARTGMSGEADYALANAALGQLAEEWHTRFPSCYCLNLEWSVWAGTGMGQRLGVIDSLRQQGISPISVDRGILMLLEALDRDDLPVSTVITGRFGNLKTLRVKHPELPFLRFVDDVKSYYPGVELMIETQLSVSDDPYLQDHILQGERVFPAVMGMEAMAQVASALLGFSGPPSFHHVQFNTPIVVTERDPLRIRIIALQQSQRQASVVIQSSQTTFQVDHFMADCVWEGSPPPSKPLIQGGVHEEELTVNPVEDLYSGILFHQGRFRRVRRYCALTAHHSVAEIGPAALGSWFGPLSPQTLLLGDPAARDAVIHSVQACIPQAPLMPVSIERISLGSSWANGQAEARAEERGMESGGYVYDIEVVDASGQVVESWEGIRYKAVKVADQERPLPPALLAPFLQRGFEEALGRDSVRIVIENGGNERPKQIQRAATILGGKAASLGHRPDGKPEIMGQSRAPISISHADSLTFAASSIGMIGCDLEPVVIRKDEDWRLLLGPEGWKLAELLSGKRQEDISASATCIWSARESLTKAGSISVLTPLFSPTERDGWFSFSAGSMAGACCIASVRGRKEPLAFAIALEKSHASL